MLQSVLVSLTSVEIHLSAHDAGSVSMVDNLLNEFHVLIVCSGYRVDLGSDLVQGSTGSRQGWQILGSTHEVYIEYYWEFGL